MNTSCLKNKYGTLTVVSVSFCSAYSQKFNWVWISWPKNFTQICYTHLMCHLKLNHHDLSSKIHTVKSYKATQADDEIKRSKCTHFRLSARFVRPIWRMRSRFSAMSCLSCLVPSWRGSEVGIEVMAERSPQKTKEIHLIYWNKMLWVNNYEPRLSAFSRER